MSQSPDNLYNLEEMIRNIDIACGNKNKEKQTIHQHDKEDCCICLEEMETKKNTTTLPCGHSIHLPCFMEFILAGRQSNNQSCPLCRGSVGFSDEVTKKLSTGQSSNINTKNMMALTQIQKDIVDILKEDQEHVYTPGGIRNFLIDVFGIQYDEKKIRANCNLLVAGDRLQKQRGTRGRCLYGYFRPWDNQ